MRTDQSTPPQPRLVYALTEPGRFVLELNALLLAHPWLRRARGGDGHPVMVLPGFMGADGSTAVLRYYIRAWGYDDPTHPEHPRQGKPCRSRLQRRRDVPAGRPPRAARGGVAAFPALVARTPAFCLNDTRSEIDVPR